jgi:hypothetical protein
MRKPIEMKPFGNMNNVVRPKRVGSSTAPAKQVDTSSSAYSVEDAAGYVADGLDTHLSGQDKHFISMIADLDEQAAADNYKQYF